jgi:hypothetical protein
MLDEGRQEGEEVTEQNRPVTWDIEVPGTFRDAIAYLDLETRKVPCRWHFPNGVPLSRRWMAFIAGVATAGRIRIVESAGDEREFLKGVRAAIGHADTVLYSSKNKFDEGILKGRFTYARRGWADEAFYPPMPGADSLDWDRRSGETLYTRLREVELDSRYVPSVYERDSALVLVHNLRDVVAMIAGYGEPDAECEQWCRRVLTDIDYAYSQVFGPDYAQEPDDR